ncbi:MAG: YgeY family selenium metabolism-linked hydrolase [Ruminococcaceae bacterium]|nr:YgeY family selenium metabolism-linked hydrolase [Oscillospiraceae bacterium]
MNFDAIKTAAQNYENDMTAFLRDLVAIPSESAQEEGVIKRIKAEMEKLHFDKVEIDPMGNVLGWMGEGDKIIAYDAHIDTVGLGEMSNWTFDPYEGYETEEEIGGRGTSDQEGGLVSAVYGAKIMKDLSLIPDGYKILVTGTVQEEDCDGLCWQYIHNELGIKPEFVVITEPTDKGIYRGQRGRMEIRVEVKGVSCHGSAPERGDNAIYKMADIITEIRDLNDRLHYDEFLGKGTVTVSQSFYNSPSRCAVADMAAVSLDRRLTDGETWQSALDEVRSLPSVKKYGAEVTMYTYERESWTGLVYPTECYFPTWVIPEDHPATLAVVEAHKGMYGEPRVDKWTFSTNGVSIMGRYGIPCIGFGPGAEAQAHAPNEKTWKEDLVRCAAVYAAIPKSYKK